MPANIAPDLAAALQQLSGEAYIELWELDTTPLYTINGVVTAGAQTYRWTSGLIDMRTDGELAAVTQTTTQLTLDRVIPLQAGRTYQVATALPNDQISTAVPVGSWTTTEVNGQTVTVLGLSLPLNGTPAQGARYTVAGTNAISFRGNQYSPMPITVSSMEWSGQGKLPRPILRVSNIGGLAGALVIANGDLCGAQVTRLRTTREFLDDGESADASAFVEPDIFLIDRKSAHNKLYVEFELAAALDQQGLKLPRRVMLRECDLIYRQWVTSAANVTGFVYGTCPYAGGNYFDQAGNAVATPAQDVCGHRLSDCLARFGQNAKLPFGGFPGINVVKT